jgi:hypothetical protein
LQNYKSVRQDKLLNVCDALTDHVLYGLRQRSVGQGSSFAFTVIEHPADEVSKGFGLGWIG